MSERGSFVTEYIYCPICLNATKLILIRRDKYLCSTALPYLNDFTNLPIIAGKIGGIYAGEEFITFELEIIPLLEEALCHEIKIAVLSESKGGKIFTVIPNHTASS